MATLKINEADLSPCVHDVIGTRIPMEVGPKRSGGMQRDEGGRDLFVEVRLYAGAETLHVALQQEHLLSEALHVVSHGHRLGGEGLPQPPKARLLPDGVRVEGTQTCGIAEERLDSVGRLAVEERFH
jgi:hypothetical protein